MALSTVPIKNGRHIFGERRIGAVGRQHSRLSSEARSDEDEGTDAELRGTDDDRSLSHRHQVGLGVILTGSATDSIAAYALGRSGDLKATSSPPR